MHSIIIIIIIIRLIIENEEMSKDPQAGLQIKEIIPKAKQG